jgi:hypothetical protein
MIPEKEANAGFEPSGTPPARAPRRSRRGGRRHSRGRGHRESAPGPAAEPMPGLAPAVVTEREPEISRTPESPASTRPALTGIGQAIEQVNQVIEELKHVLDEMEEVLETLELAERQKTDDEREIARLEQALRKLHRPGPTGPPRR